ncbi:hypothetical protein NPIL_472541 [Nephila pilipes]|uniref:Uncharacterized protein n=1 Tax=Nephila pilipes TaxID=299642 RepID=A0A8X6PYV2_NEPPI|nr:hypothetical protein NPIL_472541 [Nephila pilipes]
MMKTPKLSTAGKKKASVPGPIDDCTVFSAKAAMFLGVGIPKKWVGCLENEYRWAKSWIWRKRTGGLLAEDERNSSPLFRRVWITLNSDRKVKLIVQWQRKIGFLSAFTERKREFGMLCS